MKSVKLPGISDTAVTTVSEILAFTTLPYYQVTGILKSGEGSLAVGDLVAYDSSSKKFLKYAPGKTDVTDEAVGTGDGSAQHFKLANVPIIAGSYTIYVDGTEKTEGTDYVLDIETGLLFFFTAPGNGLAVTADYSYYANLGQAKATAVGVVRYPADASSADVPVEVILGGAVKYSIVSQASTWDDKAIDDLKATVKLMADALIF